jgi:pyridoxine 5-phosphate synthase
VVSQKKKLAKTIAKMDKASIPVSLFIDPESAQIKAAKDIGATFVELHTGRYAEAADEAQQFEEFEMIRTSAEEAHLLGLRVNAGHGLNYFNTSAIALLDPVEELSIGHAIISRAVFSGLDLAVRDMCAIVENGSLY